MRFALGGVTGLALLELARGQGARRRWRELEPGRPDPSRPPPAAAAPKGARPRIARSVIQIWMWGGPSHLDTFDPKPAAGRDDCGPLDRPIATNADGMQICQLLPLLARQAHRYSLIRSMTHGVNAHEPASYLVQTGHESGEGLVYPSAGALVSLFRGYDHPGGAVRRGAAVVPTAAPGAGARAAGGGPRPFTRFVKLSPEGPVSIPAGGKARIFLKLPAAPFAEGIKFELSGPPAGVTLASSVAVTGGFELELAAAADKPAVETRDNLLVEVSAERERKDGEKGKGNGDVQRIALGYLPAIPIEIVAVGHR